MTPKLRKKDLFFPLVLLLLVMSISNGEGVASISVRPNHLVENDGRTRNITLEAEVSPGEVLRLSVDFASNSNADTESFIQSFIVQDNGPKDSNAEPSKIRLILPKPFDRVGIYYIRVDEAGTSIEIVHQTDNRSTIKRFADWLIGSAGSGQRSGDASESASDRLDERPGATGVWTALMPQDDKAIDEKMLQLRFPSAMMPAWAPAGENLICSIWDRDKWILAAYKMNQNGQFSEQWKHSIQSIQGSDGSAAYAPEGNAVAFLRKSADGKSDIWILRLARDGHPESESKVTNLGRVLEILGWDKDLGILFEVEKRLADTSRVTQLWSMKVTTGKQLSFGRQSPLPSPYRLLRGSAPQRQTIIDAIQNQSQPVSVVYEMKANGERHSLLTGNDCSYRRPTLSSSGKWLAFDSDCPVR
jgi:hypothetical protein